MLHPADKIIDSLDRLVAEVGARRRAGQRIVFTNGCFDLIHRGHVEYLFRAAEKGDALVIALNSDRSISELKGPNRPVVPEPDRAVMLAALGCVAYVYVFDTERCDGEIEAVRPDVYVKSKGYTLDSLDPTERAALEACGASIEFVEAVNGYGTTELIQKIRSLTDEA